ncbi:MAG: hypothetical protein ACI4R9_01560 [Kiritimatiellia bacterium]
MNIAIVDIGSNTIRMNVYATKRDGRCEPIVSRKIMAGIACYVSKKKVMGEDGIRCLCAALLDIKAAMGHFRIGKVAVFATASLRNTVNSAAILSRIAAATGWRVDVLSGEDEARLGFAGVRGNIQTRRGILVDIGGGSTEATVFDGDEIASAQSFTIGSLNLYKRCVESDILPSQAQRKKMAREIGATINRSTLRIEEKGAAIVGIGGTSRAILKLARNLSGGKDASDSIPAERFYDLAELVFSRNRKAVDLIVRTCASRAHTIIPGMMIMSAIFDLAKASRLEVCQTGIREGYLAALMRRAR